jgi:methyl-accepting chemotaxis protein
MSLKVQLLAPVVALIAIGVGVSAAIGVSSWMGASTMDAATKTSLTADIAVEAALDAQDEARGLLDGVIQMTEIVPHAQIADGYKQIVDKLHGSIETLSSVATSEQAKQDIEAMRSALADWEAAAGVVLGLVQSDSVPTMELMARREGGLDTAIRRVVETTNVETQTASAQGLDHIRNVLLISGAIGTLLLLGAGVMSFIVISRVAGDLGSLIGIMRSLGSGEINVDVPTLARKDELGEMAQAVTKFRDALQEQARLEADQKLDERTRYLRAKMMSDFQSAFDECIKNLVEGRLDTRIAKQFDDPEILRIAENFNGLLDTIGTAIGRSGGVMTALAAMDLTQRVSGDFRGQFARLQSDANAVADRLADIIGQLRSTAGSIRVATGEILSGANDLSQRTNRQAEMTASATVAMSDLAKTVARTASEATRASQSAAAISNKAREGEAVIGAAKDAMDRISSSSGKISNIIGLIDDIAFQTNLLALNASVEAARAGEAGKGFSVVAVEVRRLAQSAAQASGEVKALVEGSSTEVQSGSKLVDQAAAHLGSMFEAIASNERAMLQIAGESSQQSTNIDDISVTIRELDEMTQHNSALVQETNASIEQTEQEAAQLDQLVDQFKLARAEPINSRRLRSAAAA